MSLTNYRCSDCGSGVAFYSRRRSVAEKFLLPLLLLRPYRCADCFRRSYAWAFIDALAPRTHENQLETRHTSDPGSAQRVA